MCIREVVMERNSRNIIKRLRKEKWREVRQSGSHITFKHSDFPFLITVPHPVKDLPTGTARDIAKKAGWI